MTKPRPATSDRAFLPFCAALAAACALAAAPAAQGSAGGVSPGEEAPAPAALDPGAGGLVAPAPGQPTLNSRPQALLGRSLALTGTVGIIGAGTTIAIQRRDRRRGWVTVTRATASSKGTFKAVWRTDRAGRILLRAISGGGATVRSATGAAPAQTTVTVYRTEIATWYGGPWGSRSACGKILRRSTIGVAHRTLPCGTQVEIFYGGKSMIVPVIDRGPYANNANWDLHMPVAKHLGFDGVRRIGVLVVG